MVRTFFDEVYKLLERGELRVYLKGLEALHAATPRWRWFKRYHIERQLRLGELVGRVYYLGLRHGLRQA